MKINFNTVLTHIDGEPLKNKGKELTLKAASVEALMMILESDRSATGEAKFKCYELAAKVHGGDEVEITPEDATLLKKRIGEAYGAAVVGPAYKLLNG